MYSLVTCLFLRFISVDACSVGIVFFPQLHRIPLFDYFTIIFSILQLVDTWVISVFLYLQTVLLMSLIMLNHIYLMIFDPTKMAVS